jgi:rSAM/selenodomain-associated transferase 2
MVSIIIPILNEEKIIPRLLTNLAQLEGVFEVILVDGGSQDQTLSLLPSAYRVISSLPGRARQMNKGARLASGNILLFLHADTQLPRQAITAIEKAIKGMGAIAGRFKIRLEARGFIFRIIGALINLRDGLTGGFTGDQAIFVRRDIFEKMNGFKEIPLMEDLDLARRLKKQGKVVRIPLKVTTSARRWQKEGVLKTIFLMWLIRSLFLLGVSPYVLRKLYSDVR